MNKLKLFLMFVLIPLSLISCGEAKKQSVNDLQVNKIYFFYQDGCPHCHYAIEYVNKTYPDLAMERVNIATPRGFELFTQCVRKFKLGDKVGTPLFCMGDNYIMGWSPALQQKFDNQLKEFVK